MSYDPKWILVALTCVVLSLNLVDINFTVSNRELTKKIEELEEEKSILRASYLSEISLDKLNSQANQMQMKEASQDECYKVSKSAEAIRIKKLKKAFDQKQSKTARALISTSGY